MTSRDPSPVAPLLGLLAAGELLAFERLAADARLAPDLRRQAALARMAAVEIEHHWRLTERLVDDGVDPEQAMAPYVPALRAYHERTAPRDWPEALTRACVGAAVADDFVREAAAVLPDRERRVLRQVLREQEYRQFAAEELRSCTAEDARLVHRLSLWGRRLAGEALSQAYEVAAARPELAALFGDGEGREAGGRHVGGGNPGAGRYVGAGNLGGGHVGTVTLPGTVALLRRLSQAHARRMSDLGLHT